MARLPNDLLLGAVELAGEKILVALNAPLTTLADARATLSRERRGF
jgi:hypothetical protein